MDIRPEISIIVPVYNVEKYIKKCIENILNQVYTDFELVIIDDESTDNSCLICDSYAQKDNRIKIYKKNHTGVADTRNYGINVAEGKYITFIDSDDYVSKDYLKILHDLITEHGADISVGDYIVVTDDTYAFGDDSDSAYKTSVYTNKEALYQLLATDKYIKMDTLWGKLIKAHIVKKHPFTVGRLHEDEAVSYLYYVDSTKVAVTDRIIYAYYQNESGIMHIGKNERIMDVLWSLTDRATTLEKMNWDDEANMSWLFVYGWLNQAVMDHPEKRWDWKDTYKELINARCMTNDIKIKAFLFMHFPYTFRFIQRRGKI